MAEMGDSCSILPKIFAAVLSTAPICAVRFAALEDRSPFGCGKKSRRFRPFEFAAEQREFYEFASGSSAIALQVVI